MWEAHLSGIYWEALRPSLAIDYSMQKQQQLRMDQARFDLTKPTRNWKYKRVYRSYLLEYCLEQVLCKTQGKNIYLRQYVLQCLLWHAPIKILVPRIRTRAVQKKTIWSHSESPKPVMFWNYSLHDILSEHIWSKIKLKVFLYKLLYNHSRKQSHNMSNACKISRDQWMLTKLTHLLVF